jgi:hypothetical protein
VVEHLPRNHEPDHEADENEADENEADENEADEKRRLTAAESVVKYRVLDSSWQFVSLRVLMPETDLKGFLIEAMNGLKCAE